MKLTPEQIDRFHTEGGLFFHGMVGAEGVAVLDAAVPALCARREATTARAKGSDAVRTNFAARLVSAPFAKPARHPHMVEPVESLFGEKLHLPQFKINGKIAFAGEVWQGHRQ